MVKAGDLNWEGGEGSAEAYQARWDQPRPAKNGETHFDAPREIDVDGRAVTFKLNYPYPSLIVSRDGDARIHPTGGQTRFSNQELRKIARGVYRI